MKQIAILLLSLILIGLAGPVMAKPDKNDIMHCGCVYVADEGSLTTGTASMEWKQLSVKNGKGHRNHVVDQWDDCLSGFDPIYCTQEEVDDEENLECTSLEDIKGYDPQTTTFVRDYDDCLMDGNVGWLADCDELEPPVEGDDCGFELED